MSNTLLRSSMVLLPVRCLLAAQCMRVTALLYSSPLSRIRIRHCLLLLRFSFRDRPDVHHTAHWSVSLH